MLQRLKQHQFLFGELVKRDFAKKYKRTILGMAWSILSPLMNLLIMWLVFSNLFGITSTIMRSTCSPDSWCSPISQMQPIWG